VKANIGHLETASGVAGLIKVLLALKHERLPPQVNFETANEACKFNGALEVLREERAWPAAGRSRYAGVSNFGFGGTNSHVVIGDAPPPQPPTPLEDGWHIVTISTRNHLALPAAAASYAARIDWQDSSLADIARTTTEGRAHHPFRSAFVVSNAGELRAALERAAQAEPPPASRREAVPRIAFLFPGEGAQYAGMARDLYDHEPSFRDGLDRCDEVFRGLTGSSLLGVMFNERDETAINEIRFAQSALVAVDVSLARLWRRWGIVPHAVCGHGVGELAAACDAATMTLEDAMRLAATDLGVGERRARDEAIRTLQEAGCDNFIEIGPQPQLTSLAGSVVDGTAKAHVLPSLVRGHDSRRVMRESVSQLYARGATFDWKAFNRGIGRRISLPPSPFIRESYWAYDASRNDAASPHPAGS
jgi:acyl transferase domain-containing protein